jgi:hypothetical protein
MDDSAQPLSPRRTFLKTSAYGGLVAVSAKTARGYEANTRLEIGIVGYRRSWGTSRASAGM